MPGRRGGRGGGVYSPKGRLYLSACSPSPFPSLKRPGKRLNGGRCLRRALTGWEGEDRAQGQGSALTHADIPQLGRAQLDVLENRGHDGGEKLVGGGILQPKERPLGIPGRDPSSQSLALPQRDRAVTARAQSRHRRRREMNRGAGPQPTPGLHLTPGSRAQVPHLEAAAARPANGRAPPVHHHDILCGRPPRAA